MLRFYGNVKTGSFVVLHNILTEGVFVAQLYCNAGIAVWRIVWLTTNCCFVSDILCCYCCCLLLSSLPDVVSEFHNRDSHFRYRVRDGLSQWRTEGGGSTPPPSLEFRRPSKIVPNSTRLWKLLKIAEFRTPIPQDVRKKGSKILKLPSVRNWFTL